MQLSNALSIFAGVFAAAIAAVVAYFALTLIMWLISWALIVLGTALLGYAAYEIARIWVAQRIEGADMGATLNTARDSVLATASSLRSRITGLFA